MERKVFQCDLCRAKYSKKAKLNFHLKSKHTMEKVVSVSCTLCSKKFVPKRGRLDHEKNVHLGAKEHSCKECGDTFCTKYRLDGHIRSKHGNKLQCPKGKKCFLYPHTLRQHTSRCVDERDTVFTCKRCNTDYSTKRVLDDHTKAKHKGRIYVCSVCAAEFSYNSSYNRHKKSKHVAWMTMLVKNALHSALAISEISDLILTVPTFNTASIAINSAKVFCTFISCEDITLCYKFTRKLKIFLIDEFTVT